MSHKLDIPIITKVSLSGDDIVFIMDRTRGLDGGILIANIFPPGMLSHVSGSAVFFSSVEDCNAYQQACIDYATGDAN